jgi:hypothetical protein
MEESVRWWEKKRLVYNLITLFGGLLVFVLRSGVPNGLSPNEFYHMHPYLFLGVMLLGANIFYCFGWGSEVLLNHYFKLTFFSKGLRMFLYIGGSLFSFGWMFGLIRDFLG